MKKFIGPAIVFLVILLAAVFWWRYYFVFAEGVKAGNLNYFEKKGFIFKTWEGRLVQDGFQSPNPGALQSNEFRFSAAESDSVSAVLERSGGKFVELRYKEYLNPIPWRGASEYVVTEVLEVDNARGTELPVR
ncbi:hypothetical protein SAMN04488057_11812 [Cyclobacterium lianum]|uniref:6-phosphogluconate dehydrogenase n=1 Tax=Cyclobacterium lianum TaxID=388280 RepID=A0A1M7QGX1_9BACT|nr:hypothetical protein [Cyclobacterium lianum]SHN30255.1 hypothetical protein SAMN04488057_11812 [Cyclobacterium lianum]